MRRYQTYLKYKKKTTLENLQSEMLDYYDFRQADILPLFGISTTVLNVFRVGLLGSAHEWG